MIVLSGHLSSRIKDLYNLKQVRSLENRCRSSNNDRNLKFTLVLVRFYFGGEGGIRTRGTVGTVRTLSRRVP